jgi:hypothetical protein
MTAITDADELGSIVCEWYDSTIKQLEHTLVAPEDVLITIDSDTDEPYTLANDERRFFFAGIKAAKEIIESFPIEPIEEPLVLNLG